MELVHGTHKASKSAKEEDVISTMPDNVITNIMDRLPIQDAVRTAILSKTWRYKWTLLSQLVFDYDFFEYLLLQDNGKYYGKIINRLLLHLKGVITTFVIYLSSESKLDDDDINHWLLFLSRMGIKELGISDLREDLINLPTHFYSCLELKRLNLDNCLFDPPPSFRGFPNLLRLDLYQVRFQTDKCGEFLPQCPLLEILKIRNDEPSCDVKLVEITKLEYLKTLYVSLCLLDDMTLINVSSIFHHMCLLPKLQELTLEFWKYEFLAETDDIKKISTVFPSLKTLDLSCIDLSSDIMVSFASKMIFGSPNLQTLEISARYENDVPPTAICSTEVDCNTMAPLQLRNVVLKSIKGLENEVYLIKYILACSPMLKKLVIYPDTSLESNGGIGKLELASKLLKLHRASPEAEIVF